LRVRFSSPAPKKKRKKPIAEKWSAFFFWKLSYTKKVFRLFRSGGEDITAEKTFLPNIGNSLINSSAATHEKGFLKKEALSSDIALYI
jgi:hypothetical protein